MKVNVYDTFIKGAKSGFFTVIKIMPTLIGLMVAVGVLRASGFLDFLSGIIGQFTEDVYKRQPGSRWLRLSSSNLPSSSMARSPAGVAAQPRPRTLAMILVVMCSSAGCPAGSLGNKKRIIGRIFLEAPLMIPAFVAISIRQMCIRDRF